MKFFCVIFLSALLSNAADGQRYSDAVKRSWEVYNRSDKNDTTTFNHYLDLSNLYRRNNYDSCIYYAKLAVQLAEKSKSKQAEAAALSSLEFGLRETGDLAEALNIQLKVLDIARETKNIDLEGYELNSIGNTYMELGDPTKAIGYYRSSREKLKIVGNVYWEKNERSNIGNALEKLDKPDSALYMETPLYKDTSFPNDLLPELLLRMGNAHLKLGNEEQAIKLYKEGVIRSFPVQTVSDRSLLYMQIAKLYKKQGLQDSCTRYALEAFNAAKNISFRKAVLDAALLLGQTHYDAARFDEASHFQQVALAYTDTLFGAQKFRQIQLILSNEQEHQEKIIQQAASQKRMYWIIAAVSLFSLVILFFIHKNYSQKKSYRLLQKQKNLIASQKEELEKTVSALKSTQEQLLQAEKMASLGELTAGIAHEIQNPLNFINNFSDLTKELTSELKEELDNNNTAAAKNIASDITANAEKIVHHGKRADAIIKNMLQHSRAGSGKKEPTDINALADEYLRLSYHGLRAKDKTFNADFKTHFDESVGKVNVMPQDLGRVLLNIFNNAFYALNQKRKKFNESYQPILEVSTQRNGDKVVVNVRDNGTGIPATVLNKIYQPFFTTKPTGEGTGLGLSLSYDIITKAHGGDIKVHTKEGEGTEFIITLPSE